MEGKTKFNNRLWNARRKIGLEQKQVANLLGHKTCDQISRYERGTRLPSFRTLCKLTIIYGAALAELFPEHFERFNQDIQTKADAFTASLSNGGKASISDDRKLPENFSDQPIARESGQDAPLCHYARLLARPIPEPRELAAVRRHAAKLVRTMAHL